MTLQRVSRVLPKTFELAHDIAFTFYDGMAACLAYGDKQQIFNISVAIDAARPEDRPAPDEDALSWLERTQRSADLGSLLHRVIFAALLADACHFLYEALRCSEKGKLTVAFALLRKPLKETLYYLECLLADPAAFLNTLYNEPIRQLNLSEISYRQRAVETITKAARKTVHPQLYDPEFLFAVRFDKSAGYGLEVYWMRALHLVTTRPHIATEDQNLNFIFSNREASESQWVRFYSVVPFLLHYMCDICTSVMLHFVDEIPTKWREGIVHRQIAFMLLGQEIASFPKPDPDLVRPPKQASLPLECPSCKSRVVAGRLKLLQLYELKRIKCPRCRRTFDVAALAAA